MLFQEKTTYAQKLLRLFALLLFSKGKKFSTTDLRNSLGCSKQTVGRLILDLGSSIDLPIQEELQGQRKYYWIERPSSMKQAVPLSANQYHVLQMSLAFTKQLLGKEFDHYADEVIRQAADYVNSKELSPADPNLDTYVPGRIDYTNHHKTIQSLIKAIEEKNICRIEYLRLGADQVKEFSVKPMTIFSYQGALYLYAEKARPQGSLVKEYRYNPLLAIHRIKKIEIENRKFEIPKNFDFDKKFQATYGLMKDEAFKVVLECRDWAAGYFSERVWSEDQKIEFLSEPNTIRITFKASSRPEVLSLVRSFGPYVELIKPSDLRVELIDSMKESLKNYETSKV